jgi:hypothetical protein
VLSKEGDGVKSYGNSLIRGGQNAIKSEYVCGSLYVNLVVKEDHYV